MIRIESPADWIHAASVPSLHLFLRTPAGREIRYGDLREKSAHFAQALRSRGVAPGDRVLAQIDKSVDAVLLYVACLTLGAVFVPVNVDYTPAETQHVLRDALPQLAVVRPADRHVLEPLAADAGIRHVETLGDDGRGSLLQRSPAGGGTSLSVAGNLDSPAAIVYTSGTTGRSKGAILTRGNLISNATALAAAWRFTADDVLLHTLPLFHVHGLFAAINTVLASGSSLILMPKFDASAVLKQLPVATVYMGVPTHYTRLLKESGLDRDTTSRMRLFVSGSAPLAAGIHQEFLLRTGHSILERYGMTETLMNTSNPYEGGRVPGSVGPPLTGVNIRLIPGDPAGEGAAHGIGTLEVKGPNVFAGYWGDVAKTREAFTDDGWFKTGDLARLDGKGYVYIVGRVKELVISGGLNVYPKEVESELDAIEGVLESAVFGIPHPDFGEGVTAAVVVERGARLSESALLGAVRKRLAGYKVPKRIFVLDELPRNTMGKVQKNVLRASYAATYGNEAEKNDAI